MADAHLQLLQLDIVLCFFGSQDCCCTLLLLIDQLLGPAELNQHFSQRNGQSLADSNLAICQQQHLKYHKLHSQK